MWDLNFRPFRTNDPPWIHFMICSLSNLPFCEGDWNKVDGPIGECTETCPFCSGLDIVEIQSSYLPLGVV